jgi:hypothetical protein
MPFIGEGTSHEAERSTVPVLTFIAVTANLLLYPRMQTPEDVTWDLAVALDNRNMIASSSS